MKAGLVRIGNCVSSVGYKPESSPRRKWGIFNHPRVAERLALATPRAFRDLSRNKDLLTALDQDLREGRINVDNLILAGFVPMIYHGRQGWLTFGIRYFNPPSVEAVNFKRAFEQVHSLEKGIGRKIFFGLLGVEAHGFEDLSEDMYSALLGRIGHGLDDPTFENIRYFRITDLPYDSIEKTEEGAFRLLISKAMLKRETHHYVPKPINFIPNIPINPDGKPSGGDSIN